MKKPRTSSVIALVLSAVIFIGCITSPKLSGTAWALVNDGDKTGEVTPTPTPIPDDDKKELIPFKDVIYFTYYEKDGAFYFGPNAWTQAEEAVKKGDVQEPIQYITNSDGTGDFWFRLQHDPALMAAIALRLDLVGASGEIPILTEEADLPVGERADHAHLRFLEDSEACELAYNRVK
jgi:hypothetical protein